MPSPDRVANGDAGKKISCSVIAVLPALVIMLVMAIVLTLASGCEPESGPPGAKTDDGKDLRGMITNHPKSKASISIYSGWKGGDDPGDAKPTKLGVGRQGNVAKDWDGFCLPKGRAGSVRIKWGFVDFTSELRKGECRKISDGQDANVTVR